MAYDEALAERIRTAFDGREGYAEKKMFGGVCFLVAGNMCVGVAKRRGVPAVPSARL